MSEFIEMEVVGGMCKLRFRPGCSCGSEPNGNPGFAFDFLSASPSLYPSSKDKRFPFAGGVGVIKRDDLKRLGDAIQQFLSEHPPAD
jgi:hypothetical protein